MRVQCFWWKRNMTWSWNEEDFKVRERERGWNRLCWQLQGIAGNGSLFLAVFQTGSTALSLLQLSFSCYLHQFSFVLFPHEQLFSLFIVFYSLKYVCCWICSKIIWSTLRDDAEGKTVGRLWWQLGWIIVSFLNSRVSMCAIWRLSVSFLFNLLSLFFFLSFPFWFVN